LTCVTPRTLTRDNKMFLQKIKSKKKKPDVKT